MMLNRVMIFQLIFFSSAEYYNSSFTKVTAKISIELDVYHVLFGPKFHYV